MIRAVKKQCRSKCDINNNPIFNYLYSLPRDTLFEIFSFVEPDTIRSIIQNDTSGMLHFHHEIEDFYCREHGIRFKKRENKSVVLKKIRKDGLNPWVFEEKLRERTAYFDPCTWGKVKVKFPFVGEGQKYRKYLEMMSECSSCEQNAADAEMAKDGHKRCPDCNEYEKWFLFSKGCDNTICPENKESRKNVCFDCSNEFICDSCECSLCSACVESVNSHLCAWNFYFCCGLDQCRRNLIWCHCCNSNFCEGCFDDVYSCVGCNKHFCENCTELNSGFCERCNIFFCAECNKVVDCSVCGYPCSPSCCPDFMNKCKDCNETFCDDCKDVGYCEDCSDDYCNDCNKVEFCDSWHKHVCSRCHDICYDCHRLATCCNKIQTYQDR